MKYLKKTLNFLFSLKKSIRLEICSALRMYAAFMTSQENKLFVQTKQQALLHKEFSLFNLCWLVYLISILTVDVYRGV